MAPTAGLCGAGSAKVQGSCQLLSEVRPLAQKLEVNISVHC